MNKKFEIQTSITTDTTEPVVIDSSPSSETIRENTTKKAFSIICESHTSYTPQEIEVFAAERVRLLARYKPGLTIVGKKDIHKIVHQEQISNNLIQSRPGFLALDRQLGIPFQPHIATYKTVHLEWILNQQRHVKTLHNVNVLICHGIQFPGKAWELEGVYYADGSHVPVSDILEYCSQIDKTPQILAICKHGRLPTARVENDPTNGIQINAGNITITNNEGELTLHARADDTYFLNI